GGGTLRAEGTVNEAVTKGLKKSKNKKSAEVGKKRLMNIFSTHIEAEHNGETIGKTIFDSYYIGRMSNDQEGQGVQELRYKAEFGSSITADIVSSRMYVSFRADLEKLESKVSRFLYTQMRKDRAYDQVVLGKSEHTYSLMDMMFIIRVKESQKSKRIARYRDALEEIKGNGILVKNYHVENGVFYVTWYELTDDERRDIKLLPENR
ncbi:MAG: hypothetical protein IJT00_00090, partial [Lachnospiraceae bacterium]|nr:hypothetical protein [Lachnospiraceae bacterium]